MGPPPRKFTILDLMLLVAATAIGFAIMRAYSLEALRNDLAPYPDLPKVLLTAWAYVVATLPVPAAWSVALLACRLRRPRPRWRRLASRPGFVASGAVGLVIAIRIAGFLTLMARTVGNPSYNLILLR